MIIYSFTAPCQDYLGESSFDVKRHSRKCVLRWFA